MPLTTQMLFNDTQSDPGISAVGLDALRGAARRLRLYKGWRSQNDLVRFLDFIASRSARRLVFHAPGSPDVSFDEAWCLSLFAARDRQDEPSYRFLLQSRLSRDAASEAHFLACRAQLVLDSGAA